MPIECEVSGKKEKSYPSYYLCPDGGYNLQDAHKQVVSEQPRMHCTVSLSIENLIRRNISTMSWASSEASIALRNWPWVKPCLICESTSTSSLQVRELSLGTMHYEYDIP